MKPAFPSFNKKSAVCGYRRAGFFTFYTVVDCAVEKMRFKPAKHRSDDGENQQVMMLLGAKKALFPWIITPPSCGKYPLSWLQ